MNNIKENFSYENVIKKLNNVFIDLEKNIRLDILDKFNIKTRNTKISFVEALIYKFKYSCINETKQHITNNYNFDNYTSIVRSTFYEKEKFISISIYNDIFNKLTSLYKELINQNTTYLAVDGTYNNTKHKNQKGILETSLNLGFFDINNNIPYDLTFEGSENKNKEVYCLKQYILNNKIDKNLIYVLDRAYCSYELIDFLNYNKLNFVIRFRNNCKNFNKINTNKNVRIIKYTEYLEQNVLNKNLELLHNNKKYESVTIKHKYEYTLLTNLNIKTYNDENIKNIYKKRWDVEIFFKVLKKNFNFEHLNEYNNKNTNLSYIKINKINIIYILLSKIIEKTHFYNNNDTINNKITKLNKLNKINKNKYLLKPNKTEIIKGVFRIIDTIIKGKLTIKLITITCNVYVHYNNVQIGLYNLRIAITPFYKWYVKGYTNKSDIYKILNALINKDPSELNKNLLIKYKNTEIVKYNYIK
jgi:hypothetical protein